MDINWGRRNALVEMDLPALTRLVQPAFPGAAVEAAEPMGGGHVNTNYRITVSGRPHAFLLRLHHRGMDAARKEWAVLRLVYHRAPVPEVIWSGQSEASGGLPYSILRWVDGVSLADILAGGSRDDIVQAAIVTGEALAQVGTFSFRATGFLGPDLSVNEPMERLSQSVRGFVEHCLFKSEVGDELGEKLASQVWTYAMRFSHRLDRLKDVTCLSHADFNPDHVLLERRRGQWFVAGIIDWEFAWSGSPLFDIGTMLRRTDPVCPAFAPAYAHAFQKAGGELPPEWHTLARLCDFVNLFTFLSEKSTPPPLRTFVISCLQRTVEELGGGATD